MKTALSISTLLTSAFLANSAQAAVVASTSFDGRTLITTTVANDTASNLGWTVAGVQDPGDMQSLNAAGGGLAIFNGNALMQGTFTPALNTGNGNTFWTTSVALTVLPGNTVTLTDLTFNYWAVNGGQNQNVNRGSDFTVTVFSPSAIDVGSVTVADVIGGSTGGGSPLVTAAFTTPVALSDPGTYTVEIQGGDFTGINETGNHTGIDNLSINGDIAVIPEPSTGVLAGLALLGLIARRRR